MKKNQILLILIFLNCFCSKKESSPVPPLVEKVSIKSVSLENNTLGAAVVYNTSLRPYIKTIFTQPIQQTTLNDAITLKDVSGNSIPLSFSLQNNDSAILITPAENLNYLSRYNLSIATSLKAASGGALNVESANQFVTVLDSTAKFPLLAENQLLDKIQQQTFKYFWNFAHPVSGLARERSNGDNNLVTSGGSGFGIMAIITGVSRNFITREEGLERMQTIVGFLKNTAQTFKGAYPHWLDGTTGAVIPFSANDNGADLVETSYLIQGLLCARQYFNSADTDEKRLRDDINAIWERVEWDWFRRNDQNVLYWHWSAVNTNGWEMDMQVKGWNECLITYVLAAASGTHSIPEPVYDEGWASDGAMKNGSKYYNYVLPLGEPSGGPLFFSHYSFLGLDPNGLSDAYADYELQTRNHSLINYSYCIANPKKYYGYSDVCWGLTASDIPNGYTASSPANDIGVIAPTAAISSLPYTPEQSLKALNFFYYILGDKLWKEYGFVDAFSLKDLWFADSFLAIDQGPQIVMIENYRSGLLWELFMSCNEVKDGLKKLGFNRTGFE